MNQQPRILLFDLKTKVGRKEYQHQWWCAHKTDLKLKRSKYQKKHREYILNYQQEYYIKHRVLIASKRKQYKHLHPWYRHYQNAMGRCTRTNHPAYSRYGGRGIKVYMKVFDFKDLWFRDKAYLLQRPSIDRINSSNHYTKKNCRFIELSLNSSLGSLNRWKIKHKESNHAS